MASGWYTFSNSVKAFPFETSRTFVETITEEFVVYPNPPSSRTNLTIPVSVETAETTGVSASYTAGGMTLSATMIDAENMDFLAATKDSEFWQLKAAFAF